MLTSTNFYGLEAQGGSYVRSLLPARDGRLWVGTFSGGLSVYDPARESFTRFRNDPRNPASLSHDRVEALAEDRSGRIWAATGARARPRPMDEPLQVLFSLQIQGGP